MPTPALAALVVTLAQASGHGRPPSFAEATEGLGGRGHGEGRCESELLARAGEAEFRLAMLRARKRNGRGGPELADALRSLEEARRLDPANLRALAFLGLVRLESGFDSAREPLEELFRLSEGWADPVTRELLGFVVGRLDMAFGRPLAAPHQDERPAVTWWRGWRKVVVEAAESTGTGADAARLLGALRTSPFAWERERAIEQMASGPGPPPEVIEALARALREDASPWVRAAAARALGTLRVGEWDLLLASALTNDASAWVRRRAARSLHARPEMPQSRDEAATLSPAALAALREALARDTPRVAAAAALSLGALGAEKELAAALGSSSPLVREAAALALAGPDSEEIKARLRPLLEDDDGRVRLAAARSLVLFGDRAAAGVLRSLEGSPVPLDSELHPGPATVGDAARELLKALEEARPQE